MAKKFSTAKLPHKRIHDIAALEKEKNQLYVSGDNPERLAEIVNTINFFYYGIIPPEEPEE